MSTRPGHSAMLSCLSTFRVPQYTKARPTYRGTHPTRFEHVEYPPSPASILNMQYPGSCSPVWFLMDVPRAIPPPRQKKSEEIQPVHTDMLFLFSISLWRPQSRPQRVVNRSQRYVQRSCKISPKPYPMSEVQVTKTEHMCPAGISHRPDTL
jgi:hypothetical protein